jgi:transposase
LLLSITDADRINFFGKWAQTRLEHELFALDVTSVSSYSELINDVAWGFNRDGDNLPQINICFLVGEKSRLPIFQMIYNGAIKDVSTLKSTLAVASGLDFKDISIVMDKGFATKKNITCMLTNDDVIRFIIALPFTLNFAKKQVTSEKNNIDTLDNTIVVGQDTLRGVTRLQPWNPDFKVYTHSFYNAKTACKKRDELHAKVLSLKDIALENKHESKYDADIAKYLVVKKK